jgi:alanyl-tRNA synthetase
MDRERILTAFDRFVAENLFQRRAPAPLVPVEDDSVLFTNATITPLKKLIASSAVPSPGCAVTQRCLRLQNLKHLCDTRYQPEYMSHFQMIGLLISEHGRGSLSRFVSGFFHSVFQLAMNRLQIAAAESENDIVALLGWTRHEYERIDLPSSMRWNYGMSGVSGRGIDFRVRCGNGQYCSIGQLVEVTNCGLVVGYEVGFGLETSAARISGIVSPFAASEIASYLAYRDDSLWLQLMDVISALVVLYANGIHSSQTSRGSVARKLLRVAPMLASRCGQQQISLCEVASQYLSQIGPECDSSSLVQGLKASWAARDLALSRLTQFVHNTARLAKAGCLCHDDAIERINRYAQYLNRVWPEEVQELLITSGLAKPEAAHCSI